MRRKRIDIMKGGVLATMMKCRTVPMMREQMSIRDGGWGMLRVARTHKKKG